MTYEERKVQVRSYLGKTVRVEIDRPIGYVHHKEAYDLHYPINYGYIPGVLGGDGEELDVYVLGIDTPVSECTVRVIGIAHRENDVEDKLVAAPEGMVFDQAQIAKAIHFQEQYYKTTVESLFEKSCGAILFKREKGNIFLLLLHETRSRFWSFPKGHMEEDETEEQTAVREVLEETGLQVELLPDFRESVEYSIGVNKRKQAVFFLAEIQKDPILCEGEIESYRWVSLAEVYAMLHGEYAVLLEQLAEWFNRQTT